MKKLYLIIVALCFSAAFSFAQDDFQGTISYKMKIEGEGAEMMESMIPKSIDISVLKTDMLVELKGGMAAMMMGGKTLTKGKKGEAYMIDDANEVIKVISPTKDDEGEEPAEPVVEKQDEVIEIAGYQCQKYKVTSNGAMGEMVQYVWVTDKYQLPKGKNSGSMRGMGSSLSVAGVNGLTLKTMFQQGPITMVMVADKVDLTKPSKKLFKLPKGYAKEEFDINSIMGGM